MNLPAFSLISFSLLALFSAVGVPQAEASSTSSWSSQSSWDSNAPSSADSSTGSGDGHSKPAGKSTASNHSTAEKISPFSPGSQNVALEMGQVFLMGNLGNNYSDSIGTQVHYTYGVSELFGFDSSLGYSNHSSGNLSMISALAGLRTNLAWYDKVIPYFSFGLGFYHPSYSGSGGATGASQISLQPGQSVSTTLFGVHMGPGVDLEVTRNVFFGASLTFHDMFGSTQTLANNQTVDTGGTYTQFFLHAGVTF